MKKKDAEIIFGATGRVIGESLRKYAGKRADVDALIDDIIVLADTCTDLRSRVAQLERQIAELRK